MFASIRVSNNHIQNYIYFSQLKDAKGHATANAQGDQTYRYQQTAAQLYGMETAMSFLRKELKDFHVIVPFRLFTDTTVQQPIKIGVYTVNIYL